MLLTERLQEEVDAIGHAARLPPLHADEHLRFGAADGVHGLGQKFPRLTV